MGIVHLVIMSPEVGCGPAERVKEDLLAAREVGEIAFDSVVLGRRVSSIVRDGVFAGPINTGNATRDRILFVGLADEQALSAYYEAPAHSRVRRAFLSAVSPEISALYVRASMEPTNASEIYGEIELRATRFMTRLDVLVP